MTESFAESLVLINKRNIYLACHPLNVSKFNFTLLIGT